MELGIETAHHFVAESQIHQAQRAIQFGREQWSLAAQMKTDFARDGQRGRLNARDAFERERRARQIENSLAIGRAVVEIAGQQTGSLRSGRATRRREQAQFRIGDTNLAVAQRDFAAGAIETPAPGLRINHVEQTRQLRIGMRSAAVKCSAQQAMRGIRGSE